MAVLLEVMVILLVWFRLLNLLLLHCLQFLKEAGEHASRLLLSGSLALVERVLLWSGLATFIESAGVLFFLLLGVLFALIVVPLPIFFFFGELVAGLHFLTVLWVVPGGPPVPP